MMLRRRLFLCWCYTTICGVVSLLASLSLNVEANSNPSSPSPSSHSSTNQPFHGDVISNFLNHRCGSTFSDSGTSIWAYEGTLTDPLSGKVIAEVEGLELAKQLPTLTSSSAKSSDKALLNNLCTRTVLFPKDGKPQSSSQPSWDTATTILSRKLYIYRRPSSMNDAFGKDSESKVSPSKSLLTSLRLRPDGPLRHLSPLENMAVYDSAITYISRNRGREMVVFSELGGKADIDENGNGYDVGENGKKHYVMGSAQCCRDASSSFSFAIQALKGTLNDGDRGPMLPPLKHPSRNDGSNEVVISPRRSRLLQFGKGDGGSGDNGAASEQKYRSVRESYSFTTFDISEQRSDNTSKFDLIGRLRNQTRQPNPESTEIQTPCTVKYTRYGEAPPWYAPGRMCTLELQGRRLGTANVSTSQDLPPLLSWAASKCTPSFWSGWPAIFSQTGASQNKENALAQQAVRLFSSESRRFILPNDLRTTEGSSWVSAAENTLSRLQSRLKRLSNSFIVSEVPRT